MHEFSVLIATVGEHIIKPLVWPIVFTVVLTRVIAFINGAKGSDKAD